MGEAAKILALETTDVTGSVALSENGELVAVRFLPSEQRSARSLAPAIRDILREFSWEPSDIDVVAVTTGPGSFTGLRVGVATAKMFAWSVGAKIVGVDSLDAIVNELDFAALGVGDSNCVLVSVGLDAQRGDVALRNYWVAKSDVQDYEIFALDSRFRVFSSKKWLGGEFRQTLSRLPDVSGAKSTAFPICADSILKQAFEIGQDDAIFTGQALERVRNLRSTYPNVRLTDESTWKPTAAGVASVAWTRVQRIDVDDAWNILPVYSRKAAAEEKRLLAAAAKEGN